MVSLTEVDRVSRCCGACEALAGGHRKWAPPVQVLPVTDILTTNFFVSLFSLLGNLTCTGLRNALFNMI